MEVLFITAENMYEIIIETYLTFHFLCLFCQLDLPLVSLHCVPRRTKLYVLLNSFTTIAKQKGIGYLMKSKSLFI